MMIGQSFGTLFFANKISFSSAKLIRSIHGSYIAVENL